MPFGTIEQALNDLKAGKFIVVADDEDRENEGDLIAAAEMITPEKVNFMMRAKGMICLALSPARIAQLELPMMGPENTDALRTAYTVTIDAAPARGRGRSCPSPAS
jgi:3,4-dihydroxy 2-butanone 4-phosphate synthase / GTP cyclohydrolase II